MREKEEREGVEEHWQVVEGAKPRYRKGFVHRLDQSATSFFFTNFPVDATVEDFWRLFERLGCIGEVYIPKKLDKQGKRFGFAKFREVINVKELLARMEEIWVGSFKLRVNISRFSKGEPKK
jgi:hypothetical protein